MDASKPSGPPIPKALADLGASLATRPYARRGISMSNHRIRVLLADDHAMVREGLRLLLRTAPDISVVGEAEDGVIAAALARTVMPDIVVLDLDMPGGDGMTALRELGRTAPDVAAIRTEDWPTPARRPADTRLNGEKLASVFGVTLPPWETSLARTVDAVLGDAVLGEGRAAG